MLNEVNILVDNVRHFRKLLLKEEVSDNMIIDAINNRKIIYIYYAGDDKIARGYRTIRPMVFGKHGQTGKNGYTSTGNNLLRAWQEAGSSASASLKGNRYADAKGRMKPGWRLFDVSKITSFLPTGKHFSDNDEKIASGYNPNDSQMGGGIFAAVKPQYGNAQVRVSGMASPEEPEVTKTQVPAPPPSVFDSQAKKFKYFTDAAKKTRDVTKDEIEHLYQIGKKIRKKAPSQMLVIQDENGDMVIKDKNIEDKLPPESIVGNLDDLYQKMVAAEKPIDTSFSNRVFQDTRNKLNQKQEF